MAENLEHGPRLGADPELFVMRIENKEVVPICGLVGGTKELPTPVPMKLITGSDGTRWLGSAIGGFAYQEDNVMFEFNIPACTDIASFVHSISYFLSFARNQLLNPKGLEPLFKNHHLFKRETLEANIQSMSIGCMPDFDAYRPITDLQREPFNPEDLKNSRFCGGHLHVQYNKTNCPPWIFAQLMDVVVSLAYLSWDKQGKRREFYGKPGIYREKPYGIEYRTPSNFWLKDEFRDHQLYGMAENIFELARYANQRSKSLQADYQRIPWGDVREAIQKEDGKTANEIIAHIASRTSLYIHNGGGKLKARVPRAVFGNLPLDDDLPGDEP